MEYTHPLETVSSLNELNIMTNFINYMDKVGNYIKELKVRIGIRKQQVHELTQSLDRNHIKADRRAVDDNRETDKQIEKRYALNTDKPY